MDFNDKLSFLILIICSMSASFATFTIDKPSGHQKQVLHKTLKALLNFKSSPIEDEDGNARRPNNLRPNEAISNYMKELFKRYKSSEDSTFSSNIVRSIAPKIGSVDGQDAIIFNLHSLRPSEEIIRAEIHYNLGGPLKSQHWKEKKSKAVRLYRIIASYGDERSAPRKQEMSQAPTSNDLANWLIFDAHDSVISVVGSSSSPRNNSQLAIVFAVQNQHTKKFKILPARKAWRHHSPFLLIFTDDSRLVDSQKMMSSVMSNVETINAENPEHDEQQNFDKNRVKRHVGRKESTKYYQYSIDENPAASQTSDEQNRWTQVANHVRAFQEQGPSVLQDTKKIRRHRKTKNRKLGKFDSKQSIPFGESNEEGKQKVDVSVIKQKQPFEKQSSTKFHENDATLVLLDDEPQEICQKRDLIVEFSDIGWGEWIIAPKSFEAHYCAGACPFPLPSNSNPSNHAVIQSIIHTVGLHPGVPQICCAPEKMDSLTLLYFDEEQNVVLKNYPKMTVSSCGCL